MNKQDEMAALLVSMRRKVSEAKKHAVTVTYIDAVELEKLLDYTESLEPLAKEAPFKLGDVVREVGAEDPTGTIIQIKEGEYFEQAYVVKLYKPFGITKTITYYHDEIELIRRGNG